NLKWFTGEADGFFLENGHTGQWGLRLGRLLVDSIRIPVAIFNNGCGGTPISYYERPPDYKTNPNSNYGRLYFRLTKTGLQNNVRAILWSQGETDALNGTSTPAYELEFDTLENSFMQDFPGFKKTYIFQTRNGCGANIYSLMDIKEAQRQEAVMHDTDIEIMSTSALRQDSGDCHFDYKGGYEIWGNRIYNVIARDIYGITPAREVDAPMVTAAYLADSTTMIVVENADSLIQHDYGFPIQNYELENSGGAVIDTIYLNKNKIIFQLSKYPGTSAAVSYLAQYKDSANWLTNTNDIEVLCFYQYPVADSIGFINTTGIATYKVPTLKVFPNPFHSFTHISLSISSNYYAEVDDITGRRLQRDEFNGKNYELSSQNLTPGLYFVRIFDKSDNLVGTSKIVVQ
ncbi:MAG TPA: sialate O-acetylesterase, partial [Bacteroidia bacterium]|nr:sialate O-acetylesterase [Bacteroidia bacterium]